MVKVPKANDPLGVCSIFDHDDLAITCPIRFRERWIVVEDAAGFFFPTDAKWTSLTEVPLKDQAGGKAGNLDLVLVSYDSHGKLVDYGALEIQAVYISGNVRRPFEHYMQNPVQNASMDWLKHPRADYLSSSRKRLAPQLLYKGGILRAWDKKLAVALHHGFFDTLPVLQGAEQSGADIAWLIYELRHDTPQDKYLLSRLKTVYTLFSETLEQITKAQVGDERAFLAELQSRLDEKLDNDNPPDAPLFQFGP